MCMVHVLGSLTKTLLDMWEDRDEHASSIYEVFTLFSCVIGQSSMLTVPDGWCSQHCMM